MDKTIIVLILITVWIFIGAVALIWVEHRSELKMRQLYEGKKEESKCLRLLVNHMQKTLDRVDTPEAIMDQYVSNAFTDTKGNRIHIGDVLVDPKGMEFEVKCGMHKMFCPVDNVYKDTIGVYCTCDVYSLEAFPLGDTHEWALIKK